MPQTMIEVKNLAKDYGLVKALRGISFEVPTGEVLGFLGPNGAGKTTTMKILTCFMAPTAGSAAVNGKDVIDSSLEVRRAIGYLPEDTPIYTDMTSLEFLQFICSVRDVPQNQRRKRIRDVAEVCGLMEVLAKPIGDMSKGFRQRVGLAQAMLHDPPILILDEPTSGLDPNQIVEIRELIKEIGKEKTVILSTHILPEVQATCGRVIIIAGGKLVADGSPDELAAMQSENNYRVLIDPNTKKTPYRTGDNQIVTMLSEKLEAIGGVKTVSKVRGEDDAVGLMISAEGKTDLRREIFRCVRDNDWLLLEMQRHSASLEDVFRRLTGKKPADGAKAAAKASASHKAKAASDDDEAKDDDDASKDGEANEAGAAAAAATAAAVAEADAEDSAEDNADTGDSAEDSADAEDSAEDAAEANAEDAAEADDDGDDKGEDADAGTGDDGEKDKEKGK